MHHTNMYNEQGIVRIQIFHQHDEQTNIVIKNNSTKGPIYRLNQNNQDAKSRLERKSRFSKSMTTGRK